MLLILLQAAKHAVPALQQATSNAPPPSVYVTVQQPSAGMPEWIKILLTAAVGALVGIASNIAMEYVKPWIAKRLMKKTVKTQIFTELLAAGSDAESAQRILASAAAQSGEAREFALQCAAIIGSGIESDRYDFYFIDQKALVYEIDEAKLIAVFHKAVKEATAAARANNFDSAQKMLGVAAGLLKTSVTQHKLKYVPHPNPIETAYQDGRTSPPPSEDPGIQSPS
jgi:hypothetical protein